MANQGEFRGDVILPGEQEPHKTTLVFDADSKAVTVKFDSPVAGTSELKGSEVSIVKRLKYYEVVFATSDVPQETVDLTWKCNADLDGASLAGVVIARPNSLRVTGEKGFILSGA